MILSTFWSYIVGSGGTNLRSQFVVTILTGINVLQLIMFVHGPHYVFVGKNGLQNEI